MKKTNRIDGRDFEKEWVHIHRLDNGLYQTIMMCDGHPLDTEVTKRNDRVVSYFRYPSYPFWVNMKNVKPDTHSTRPITSVNMFRDECLTHSVYTLYSQLCDEWDEAEFDFKKNELLERSKVL